MAAAAEPRQVPELSPVLRTAQAAVTQRLLTAPSCVLVQVRGVEEAEPDEGESVGLKAFHKLEQHLSN